MNYSLIDFSKADNSALMSMANDLKNRSLFKEIKSLSEMMDKIEEEKSIRVYVLESEHKILKSKNKTIKKLTKYPLLIRQLIHESK
jgi:hypothetical protein